MTRSIGFFYYCYAHQTQLLFLHPPTMSKEVCLSDISFWMKTHNLKLNPNKTELMCMLEVFAGPHNQNLRSDFSKHITSTRSCIIASRSCIFGLCNFRKKDHSRLEKMHKITYKLELFSDMTSVTLYLLYLLCKTFKMLLFTW